MTERLNNRDWKLISAYLDARLSPSGKASVEERLKEDPLLTDPSMKLPTPSACWHHCHKNALRVTLPSLQGW